MYSPDNIIEIIKLMDLPQEKFEGICSFIHEHRSTFEEMDRVMEICNLVEESTTLEYERKYYEDYFNNLI